ncbi:MAG: hypothetical protein PWR01_328 [Clostridiales bacterium]|jgi:stage II sporulation protein GA (sporulation sigma-E factor processing peptidase)|nr:hypothetical protein [Clostridiales bacterium]
MPCFIIKAKVRGMGMLYGVEYRYVDILWLDNFVMNFSILWITFRISKVKGSLWRLWISAGIGALYAIIFFIPGFEVLHSFFLKIALSLIMLLVAFKFNTFKDFFKAFTFFYATTFVFGGVALGLYFFTQDYMAIQKGVFVIKDYPVNKLILTGVLVIILMHAMWRFIRLHLSKDELLYKVKIYFDGKEVMVDALLDTGNMLLDPISKHPVMVVEFSRVKELLPQEIREIFTRSLEGDFHTVVQVISKSGWIERFRIIPYTTVGNPSGLLMGFKPDEVLVLKNGKWYTVGNVVVGIYNDKLSKSEHYQALVHPEIVA